MANQNVNTEESLESYFQEISRYPLLSTSEEVELSKEALEGNKKAWNRLINSNLRLVVKIAKSFASCGLSLTDLIQEGNIGLMTAAKKFDWKKGVRFSTYAAWWIKQGILRAITNKKRLIRIPHRKEESLVRLEKFISQFNAEHGREPTAAEVAGHTGMSEKEVKLIMNVIHPVQSLDRVMTEDGAILIDAIEDYRFDPYVAIDRNASKENVEYLMRILAEKEKQVLMYRFSFYDGKKYTLKNISEKLGISAETVRQIEMKAINKLRQQSMQMGLAG